LFCILIIYLSKNKLNLYFFAFLKIIHTFAAQIKYSFLLKGCLVFIKKGGEIRLLETLATNPLFGGERCQNLIPV